jgi:hypothetical protein
MFCGSNCIFKHYLDELRFSKFKYFKCFSRIYCRLEKILSQFYKILCFIAFQLRSVSVSSLCILTR